MNNLAHNESVNKYTERLSTLKSSAYKKTVIYYFKATACFSISFLLFIKPI